MHTSPSDLHMLPRLSDLMLFLEVLWGWSLSHLVQSRTSKKWSCTLATFFLCESEGLDKLHPYRTAAVLVDSRTSVWICDVVRLSPQSMHHLRAWNRISVAVMWWSWGYSSSHWLRNWCIPWGLGMENGSSSSGPSVEKVWLWHTMMLAAGEWCNVRTPRQFWVQFCPQNLWWNFIGRLPSTHHRCNWGTGGPGPIGSVAGSGYTGYSYNTYGTADDEWRRLLACLEVLLAVITWGVIQACLVRSIRSTYWES